MCLRWSNTYTSTFSIDMPSKQYTIRFCFVFYSADRGGLPQFEPVSQRCARGRCGPGHALLPQRTQGGHASPFFFQPLVSTHSRLICYGIWSRSIYLEFCHHYFNTSLLSQSLSRCLLNSPHHIYLSIYLSIYPSIYPSIYLPIYLSIYRYIYIHLSSH